MIQVKRKSNGRYLMSKDGLRLTFASETEAKAYMKAAFVHIPNILTDIDYLRIEDNRSADQKAHKNQIFNS